MKLGDVYKHKENNSIIQIDSFATPMGRFLEGEHIIVFRQIEKHNDMFGSLPSFDPLIGEFLFRFEKKGIVVR